MNQVQIWFLIVAGLLGIGIPILFIGIQLPSAMNAAMLAEAAEYVILDEEDQNFWAQIPGRTGLKDIKEFYIFHCLNPEEVALRGEAPKYVEVGPFRYMYEHALNDRKYHNDGDEKNTRVEFTKQFVHQYLGKQEDLEKEYRVINLSGMKRWNNAKSKPRFKLAIEGFFETFTYAKHNLVRDNIIRNISSYYANPTNVYKLTEGLKDVKDKVRTGLANNKNYGLFRDRNAYEWTQMCDSLNPRIEHEIYRYFGFSLPSFIEVRSRFCNDFLKRYESNFTYFCDRIKPMDCSNYNISYYQWMYGNLLNVTSYRDITFKQLFGVFEFSVYRKKFMEMINKAYRDQFKNVVWNDKNYYYLLDSYYEYPDYNTDPSSVLLYANMRSLFSAGKATVNPFSSSVDDGVSIDLSRFDEISSILKLTKEQAFMLYCYFDHYVNNTVLLQDIGGDPAKERIANFGALVLKDISDYCSDYLDVVLYTRVLHKRAGNRTCEDAVKYYFTVNETEKYMATIANAFCHNSKFHTDLSNPLGYKHFVEIVSYPYDKDYYKLYAYLVDHITNFSIDAFEAMIYGSKSKFANELSATSKSVKLHYSEACNNDYSEYCTKKQLFFGQFYKSLITSNPFAEAGLNGTNYIGDWWRIIEKYLGNDEEEMASPGGYNLVNVTIPDKPIEIPMEFKFLEKHYNESNLNIDDLYECLNFIELFDTDVLYSLLINIEKKKEPKSCKNFATAFFYNSVRYFIRNIWFGPMFKRLHPQEAFFTYFDKNLEIEHKLIDYLEGDDCTVDPVIGYNPEKWNLGSEYKTLDYLRTPHVMYTGSNKNSQIRKYTEYHGSGTIYYRKLYQDTNGDTCYPSNTDPFKDPVTADIGTDGLQFAQYGGKTKLGDTKFVIEPNVYRPLKIIRKNDEEYVYGKLDVNVYVVDFKTEYYCPEGMYKEGAADMTSFYQYKSVITPIRYENISEPELALPKVNYANRSESDHPLDGYNNNESYYAIEPYTGIAMQTVKKIMSSLLLYYDSLYVSSGNPERGEFVPYYSLYENSSVDTKFANDMLNSILSMQSTRRALSISFTVIGILFVFGGIAMIVRSCFFDPDEVKFDDEYDLDEIQRLNPDGTMNPEPERKRRPEAKEVTMEVPLMPAEEKKDESELPVPSNVEQPGLINENDENEENLLP